MRAALCSDAPQATRRFSAAIAPPSAVPPSAQLEPTHQPPRSIGRYHDSQRITFPPQVTSSPPLCVEGPFHGRYEKSRQQDTTAEPSRLAESRRRTGCHCLKRHNENIAKIAVSAAASLRIAPSGSTTPFRHASVRNKDNVSLHSRTWRRIEYTVSLFFSSIPHRRGRYCDEFARHGRIP